MLISVAGAAISAMVSGALLGAGYGVAVVFLTSAATGATCVAFVWVRRAADRVKAAHDQVSLRERVSRALDVREHQLTAILEVAGDAIVTADARGRIISWNPGAESIFGYSRSEAWGRPLSLILEDDIWITADDAGGAVVSFGGQPLASSTLEIDGLRKSGHRVALEVSLGTWVAEGVRFMCIVLRDISERRRAEVKLRRSELLHRRLVANLPDTAVLLYDRDLRITIADGGRLRELGVSPSDIEGRELEEVLPPDLREVWVGECRSALDAPPRRHEVNREGRSYVVHLLPIGDGETVFAGMAMIQDVTERRRVEDALEERTRLASLAADVGLALTRARSIELGLRACADAIVGAVDIDRVRIWAVEDETATPQLVAEAGVVDETDLLTETAAVEALIASLAARPSRPLVYFAGHPGGPLPNLSPTRALASFALVVEDRLMGVMAVYGRRGQSDSMIQALGFVANGIAMGIERARGEQQIARSLIEKETLLKEVHHRVKNNMQVISSLLRLQTQSIESEAALDVFREGQQRVEAMALVHEKLYGSEDLSRVDFADYLRDLASKLTSTYVAHGSLVSLEVDADDLFLGVDKAIPCGLIVNELVSNALKYAFPDGRSGVVRLSLDADADDGVTMTVADTGVGLPDGLDIENASSLGLRLVTILVEQIGGRLEIVRSPSTAFKIRFTVPKSTSRTVGRTLPSGIDAAHTNSRTRPGGEPIHREYTRDLAS